MPGQMASWLGPKNFERCLPKEKPEFKFNSFTPRVSYGDLDVMLTFKSVDEFLQCDHSNETSSAVLSHGTIYILVPYKMKFGGTLGCEMVTKSQALTTSTFRGRVNLTMCCGVNPGWALLYATETV